MNIFMNRKQYSVIMGNFATDTFEFEEDMSEVSPKYVKDGKKYGRHSRPGTDTEGDLSEALSLATCQSDPSGTTEQNSPGVSC